MYRQPLRSEARLGSTTGLTGPRAVGLAAEAENRQPLQMAEQCHSVTGPSSPQAVGPASAGNLRRSAPPPPLSAVCSANLSSQSAPWPPEPSFWVCSRWPEPFGPPTPRRGHRPWVSLGVGDWEGV